MATTGGTSRPLDDRRVLAAIDDAPVLYSAVNTGRGSHVTPTAFSRGGGALWFVALTDSVKVRALRRRPRVGLLLRSRRDSVVATGFAEVVDPLRLRGLGSIGRLVDLPFAALGYTGRNAAHIAGVLRDADLGPSLVLDRVAVRVELERAALVREGGLIGSWGRWTSVALLDGRSPAPFGVLPDDELPESVRPLLREPGPGCLAWPSVHGPIALPVDWPGASGDRYVDLDPELMTLVGAQESGPAALAVSTGGYRLATKRGFMLRGDGQAGGGPDGRTRIGIATRRVTYWQADRSATVQVPATSPRA